MDNSDVQNDIRSTALQQGFSAGEWVKGEKSRGRTCALKLKFYKVDVAEIGNPKISRGVCLFGKHREEVPM